MDCAQAVCADGHDQIAVAPLKNGAEPVTPRRATGLISAGQSIVHSPHNDERLAHADENLNRTEK